MVESLTHARELMLLVLLAQFLFVFSCDRRQKMLVSWLLLVKFLVLRLQTDIHEAIDEIALE